MVRIVVGVLLVLIGAVWFGQGMGWIGGGSMSGETLWAVVGPVLAVLGAGMVASGLRRRPHQR
jgi:hypothetical protein